MLTVSLSVLMNVWHPEHCTRRGQGFAYPAIGQLLSSIWQEINLTLRHIQDVACVYCICAYSLPRILHVQVQGMIFEKAPATAFTISPTCASARLERHIQSGAQGHVSNPPDSGKLYLWHCCPHHKETQRVFVSTNDLLGHPKMFAIDIMRAHAYQQRSRRRATFRAASNLQFKPLIFWWYDGSPERMNAMLACVLTELVAFHDVYFLAYHVRMISTMYGRIVADFVGKRAIRSTWWWDYNAW